MQREGSKVRWWYGVEIWDAMTSRWCWRGLGSNNGEVCLWGLEAASDWCATLWSTDVLDSIACSSDIGLSLTRSNTCPVVFFKIILDTIWCVRLGLSHLEQTVKVSWNWDSSPWGGVVKPLESFLTSESFALRSEPPICCCALLCSRAHRPEPPCWSSCATTLVEPFVMSPLFLSHSATLLSPLPRAALYNNCIVVCYQTPAVRPWVTHLRLGGRRTLSGPWWLHWCSAKHLPQWHSAKLLPQWHSASNKGKLIYLFYFLFFYYGFLICVFLNLVFFNQVFYC